MLSTDIAYVAGLFDGEGSVSFCFVKASKNGVRYGKLFARISQNDRHVLDWVQRTMGFGSVHGRKRPAKTTQICHDYVVAHEKARIFLAMIRPHLKVKGDTVDVKLALDAIHCHRRRKINTEP